MKLGIQMSLWTPRPLAAEHGPLLHQLATLGYDAAELHVYAMNTREIEAWAATARKAGIALVPSVVMRPGEADAASADVHERQGAVEAIKRGIEAATAFGSDVVVGPMFQAVGRFTGQAPTPQELDRVAETLSQAAQFAADAGVTLAAEPLNRFESYIANTLSQAAAILDRINPKHQHNIQLLADTFHANIEEKDAAQAITAHANRIAYIHISENHRGVPGEGHAAHPDLFRALQSTGYDGHITIEAFTNKHPPLNQRLRIWRPLFEGNELDLAKRGATYIRNNWQAAAKQTKM